MKKPLIVAFALVSALLGNAARALTLTSTDRAVLIVALAHFNQSNQSAQYNAQGYLAASPETTALVSSMTNQQYQEILKAGPFLVPEDALADYVRRNRKTYKVSSLDVPGGVLRVQTLEQAFTGLAPSPGLRTYVSLRAPGYSTDRTCAYLNFDFRWSIHGASAFYLLKLRGGVWTIVESDYAFAV
jgi:hypothetical protein